jgi:hypothetical protein
MQVKNIEIAIDSMTKELQITEQDKNKIIKEKRRFKSEVQHLEVFP